MSGRSPEDFERLLIVAREAYYKAKFEAEALEKIRAELGLNSPDGRASVMKAIRIERHALQVYAEILRVFSTVVLGKMPRRFSESGITDRQAKE